MPLFSKYSGAGNDFAIVRGEELGLRDPAALAAQLCPRATGVGVDGLITVRSLSEELVRLRFFNPDGSEFATCGNGSRCAARYAVDRGIAPAEHLLVTDHGEILARVDGDRTSLAYALDARLERPLEVRLGSAPARAWFVRMGTRHLVVDAAGAGVDAAALGALPRREFEALCRPLRWLEPLGPGGANVHLVAPRGEATAIRTFERGVEGETLACGSGCMASAFALDGDRSAESGGGGGGEDARDEDDPAAARVFATRSGDEVEVAFLEAGRIGLAGPARFIFDGVFPEA